MEDIYFKKLAKLIYDSNLKDEQKILWGIFIKNADSEENEAVYEAVSESNDNLMLLTQHLNSKIDEIRARA